MGGVAYLIPVDAQLEKDAHVLDETLPLDRVLQKAEAAKKLRLVILDACRNNPFATRMARTGSSTRSIGRGLPALEPEGDILVAYSTSAGLQRWMETERTARLRLRSQRTCALLTWIFASCLVEFGTPCAKPRTTSRNPIPTAPWVAICCFLCRRANEAPDINRGSVRPFNARPSSAPV